MSQAISEAIEGIKERFAAELAAVTDQTMLVAVRDRYLSRKKGEVTDLLNRMRDLPPSEKPLYGKAINDLKNHIEAALAAREQACLEQPRQAIDFTLPAPPPPPGRAHLLNTIRREIEEIFITMGYGIAEGPEMESEYYNFTALNFLEHHPARDEHDTFFIDELPNTILRTHTSPVQVRFMEAHPPPIQIIAPGKVFRKDDPDATHTPVFHQIEGLVVDRGITFSDLRGTLEHFIHAFFGPRSKVRFRPSYFPFTEPSAEVDMSCFLCPGDDPGCRVCKGTGWLEILGCGMVHPQVLRYGHIDPTVYSGFAFGMGIERIAMVRYGVHDLRLLYENDLRLLQQFD